MVREERVGRVLLGRTAAVLSIAVVMVGAITLLARGPEGENAEAAEDTDKFAASVSLDGEDPAGSTTTSEVFVCHAPDGTEIDCLAPHEHGQVAEVQERGIIGWGSAQPTAMAATVMYGSTGEKLTPERRALLASQLETARAAAAKTPTVKEALEQGFVRNFQYVDGRGIEYINWDRFVNKLDLSKPSMLAATGDDPDDQIVSVAYNVLGTREAGPPTDMPLEVIGWHYHHNLCRLGDSVIGNVQTNADGTLNERDAKRCLDAGAVFLPELDHYMVDLWVVPGWENPWGLISARHPDLYREPTAWFPQATTTTTAPAPAD